MKSTATFLNILVAASIAAVSLAAPAARAQTTALNSGNLGAAGNGINSAGVTLGLPGPLAAPGDAAAGYFNSNPGGLGTFTTQVAYNAALNPPSSSPFTIEFWAKPAVIADNLGAGPCPVFNRVSAGDRSGWVFFQRPAGTGWNLRMYSGSGSNVGVDLTGGTSAADTWSYIVAVWNGTTASLYHNGSLVTSAAGPYRANTGAVLSIGAYDTGENSYNGVVDELAICGTALSASQILAHYSAASSPTPGVYRSLVLSNGAIEYLQQVPEPAKLVWNGAVDNVWDVNSTANFSGNPSGTFSEGDHVTFDDSGSNTTITIAAGGVAPGSIVFSNTPAADYSLSDGPIKGATSLAVSGGGMVTLSSANAYTGGTMVSAGMLTVAAADALPGGRSLTIGNGGTVVLQSGLSASAVSVSAVPEPSTLALLGIAAIGLSGCGWRWRS